MRWGMRLFEADRDMIFAVWISKTFVGGSGEVELSRMVHQSERIRPINDRLFYRTEENADELANHVAAMRKELDTNGLGYRLMEYWRASENSYDGKYHFILVGALLMRAGAKIKDSDMQHLRELVPQINCNPNDIIGFLDPGRAQFLAALDHYQPGTPRCFEEPSCYRCGKIKADIGGQGLKRCARCKKAFYCNRDCQKAHWLAHKPYCNVPEGRPLFF
ncbi:hypothetical protein F5B20DRAFT_575000 [Whalleya microplaca]|nr:hypothetical protein F5B20DRAFT_575000 [Whalleya microplaca]